MEKENLFKKSINSTINNSYVYGTIILLLMVFIFLTFSIHNLSNVKNQVSTISQNVSRISTGTVNNDVDTSWINTLVNNIFQKKNTQIIVLGLYLILTTAFLFLYNRAKDKEKGGYGKLNIFTDREEKIKSDMAIPIVNLLTKIGYITGGIFLLLIVVVFVLWIYNSFSLLQNLLSLILTIFNFILLLTLVYALFQNQINRLLNNKTEDLNLFESIIKIIGEFIFLIPCLVIMLIDVFKYQVKITTPAVWIVLIAEIIIITLYFLIPFLMKNLNEHDGKMLLEGPVFIDKKRMIGTYQNVEKLDIYRKKIEEFNFALFKTRQNFNTFDLSKNEFTDSEVPFNLTVDLKVDNTYGQKLNFNYNYGVSFFLYLNPQPINTSRAYVVDTPIFDYATKPKIVFNGLEQRLKFICTDINNLEQIVYETNDIKYQKWMHIVVNYRSGFVDIFIDGTLRATQNNLQPFMEFSKIYVGSDEGIAGGIRNVMYFSKPLTIDKIKYMNIFM